MQLSNTDGDRAELTDHSLNAFAQGLQDGRQCQCTRTGSHAAMADEEPLVRHGRGISVKAVRRWTWGDTLVVTLIGAAAFIAGWIAGH